MIKVCRIRIYPNKTQQTKIFRILGACRFIYNLYIQYNNNFYREKDEFLSGYDFAKMVTKLKKREKKYMWLQSISTKALTDSIMTAELSLKKFFKGKTRFPRYKTKKTPVQSYFFIKDNIHFDTGKKNIIKIPILGNVRITQRDYLPEKESITSGRIIYDHNKFFVSFIYSTDNIEEKEILSSGMGIDVGIEKYASIYRQNGSCYQIKSFLKDEKYLKLTNRIKRLQQIISFKVEENYRPIHDKYVRKHDKEPDQKTKINLMKKGGCYSTSNIKRVRKKITNTEYKLNNYVKDKIDKLVNSLVRTKPEYITIEDLSIKNMLQNDSSNTLHDHISKSRFRYFRTKLEQKCLEFNVELRFANMYFASSKKCSSCGNKNKKLTLNNRVYKCPNCGLEIDRDLNAAINLCNLKKYSLVYSK